MRSWCGLSLRLYGPLPFTAKEIKAIADEVGLIIPGRVDMTFKGAFDKGKPLFRAVSRGKYQPTVSGETFLSATYGVKKGTRKKTSENGE
jgi:hypothetical protein